MSIYPNTPPESDDLYLSEAQPASKAGSSFFAKLWQRLVNLGLDKGVARLGSVVFTALLLVGVVLIMGRFYASPSGGAASAELRSAPVTEGANASLAVPAFIVAESDTAIDRQISLHTILPALPRTEIITYTIQPGDSLFSIAEKFELKPETILWGNRYTLGDDPHMVYAGQELIILPVDGTLHRWSAGEGLNGVAEYYGVTPEDIINYPANHLNPATLGDYANPNIAPGTLLVIPGGKGEFPDWRTPRITRDNPATAVNVGPGACTGSYDGVMGTLIFTWPVANHYLTGYNYDPGANHFGIDIFGELGELVHATDNGVVVYAGWNDWGYGEMVVIDHGQGWQSLYAHLSTVEVSCGQEVYQGDVIGTVGSTGSSSGPHLHFELRSDEFGRVNPWDFLQ